MYYLKNKTDCSISEPTVLSLGKFDGFHLGHRLLMEQLLQKKKQGLAATIFTFHIPPRTLVNQVAQRVLLTNQEKRYLLEMTGIDYFVEYPFTKEIRQMEPRAFLKQITEQFSVKCIVAGEDFRFGKDRSGDSHTIIEWGKAYGLESIIIEKRQYHEEEISSTRIREYLLLGKLKEANERLGYPFFLRGGVLHGKQLGRTLGFPTINQMSPEKKLLPPYGVYVTQAIVRGKTYGAVTNIGKNPTIRAGLPVVAESFLFDFNEEIYGEEVEIRFLEFLRSEMKFHSLEALKEQMERDAARAYAFLKVGRKFTP
ncbi:riboflavin biosynthesis protein [Clostridia bacterium]|nr:riboflavin biosynthesis protein [Clostridia bacterium]